MIRTLAASLLLLCFAGCEAASVITYKLTGPPKVPAKYTPDKTKPLLVLVENPKQRSAASTEPELIAGLIIDQLNAKEVAPMIDLTKLHAVRDAHVADYSKMSIAAIGRAAGAAQVIYVQLDVQPIRQMPGGDTMQGQAAARVKLIDVVSGETLWPTDLSDGYEVGAASELGKDRAKSAMDVREGLARSLADQVARLFYKWEPTDMSPGQYE